MEYQVAWGRRIPGILHTASGLNLMDTVLAHRHRHRHACCEGLARTSRPRRRSRNPQTSRVTNSTAKGEHPRSKRATETGN